MILRSTNIKILFALFILCALKSYTQTNKVNIFSNFDTAYVYIDSQFIGTPPILNYVPHNDTFLITAKDEKSDSWFAQKICIPVILQKDTTFNIIFKNKLNIVTNPDDASIYLNERLIGKSPLFFNYDKNGKNYLKIFKENFAEEKIDLDSIKGNTFRIKLNRQNNPASEHNAGDDESYSKSSMTYLIIGGIASGLISGYTKMKADHFEKEYDLNKNGALKNKIYTLDTISHISLVILEGCLITINYLLLKD